MTDMGQTVDALFHGAIMSRMENMPRSRQAREGILGPSELGWCRNKAALTVKGTPPSDSKKHMPLFMGTALHAEVALALKAMFPHWLVEDHRVTARFPSGVEIGGVPDVIAPDLNAVIDTKGSNGLEWQKRQGQSQSNKYQLHTYALGAIAEGLLDPSKPIYLYNWFVDRSKGETLALGGEMDPSLTDQIDSWIGDVVYAVKNGEDASRDIAAATCEALPCEFFTVCRGQLPTSDNNLIEDPDMILAVEMYVEGRAMAKEGKRIQDEMSAMLDGIEGSTGSWQVRHTNVSESYVPGYERRGYSKTEVVKVRKP